MFCLKTSKNKIRCLRCLCITIGPFLCFTSATAQISFFGDVHVAANTEFHIAFPTTYFKGGILYTDRNDEESIISFGENSIYKGASSDSYIDGIVRIYHNGRFIFPIGDKGVFSPISVVSLYNPDGFQISYQLLHPQSYFSNNTSVVVTNYHYWSWKKTTGSAYFTIDWNPKHGLLEKIQNSKFSNYALSELRIGGFNFNQWEEVPSLLLNNIAHPNSLPSWEFGSLSSRSLIDLNTYSALSFVIHSTKKKRIISQVITPNGDGLNDTWKIQGVNFKAMSKICVYNLDAELIFFHMGEYQNDWTGTDSRNSKELDSGIYYYTIDIQGNGELIEKNWIYIKRR